MKCRTVLSTRSLLGGAPLLCIVIAAGLSAAQAAPKASYACDDGIGFTTNFTPPGAVAITFTDGRRLALPQAKSADGGRYAKGSKEFWITGNKATFADGNKVAQCEVVR